MARPPYRLRENDRGGADGNEGTHGNHRTISTGAWESRTDREIPTLPQANLLLDAGETRRNGHAVLPMYPVCFVTDVSGCAGRRAQGTREQEEKMVLVSGALCPVPFPCYPINPTSLIEKLLRFGNAQSSSPGVAPNHLPSVAPNWAAAIVGIHTPRLLASSGPENAKVGIWP